MARVIVPVTLLTPPKASLTTALTGTNNDLVFTAKQGGPGKGNATRVQYIDPGGVSATLSVTVVGLDILVSLGRAASAINSTANDVKLAVTNAAGSLVDVALAAANDGTGLVTALALTNLAGGSLQTTPPTQTSSDATNGHYFTGNDGATTIEAFNNNAASKTVSILYAASYSPLGTIPAQVETIPNAATRVLGPFSPEAFSQPDGSVYFDCNIATDMKFRVYRTVKAA